MCMVTMVVRTHCLDSLLISVIMIVYMYGNIASFYYNDSVRKGVAKVKENVSLPNNCNTNSVG